tara:strand:+ start:21704 stop:21970 length:267 start_codon:yes stop_codon:yes gene_type:complete
LCIRCIRVRRPKEEYTERATKKPFFGVGKAYLVDPIFGRRIKKSAVQTAKVVPMWGVFVHNEGRSTLSPEEVVWGRIQGVQILDMVVL